MVNKAYNGRWYYFNKAHNAQHCYEFITIIESQVLLFDEVKYYYLNICDESQFSNFKMSELNLLIFCDEWS